MKNYKKYQKLVNDVFSQGDARYFDNYGEQTITDFLIKSAIEIEIKDVSAMKSKVSENEDKIKGPQRDLKLLTKNIFKEYGVTFTGFETRISFGIVDVIGKKAEKNDICRMRPLQD